MVEGHPEFAQVLRHEAISGLIVMQEPMRSWLIESGYELDTLYPALWAAVGHHRKFGGDYLKARQSHPAEIFLGHRDFRAILAEMSERLGLDIDRLGPLPSVLTIGTGLGGPCDVAARQGDGQTLRDFDAWTDEHDAPEFDRSVAIMKSLGIAADVCASAYAGASMRRTVGRSASL